MTDLNLQEGLDDLVKYVKGEPSHVITSKGDGNLIISEMHYDSMIAKNKMMQEALESIRHIIGLDSGNNPWAGQIWSIANKGLK